MMSRRIASVVFLFALLVGCTPGTKLGGGPLPIASATPTPTSAPPASTSASVTFTFTMPTIASMKSRRPLLASANTQSLAIFIYAQGSQPSSSPTTVVNVGANASGCTVNSVAGQITCSVTVAAPLGSQELEIVAMSGPNGTGTALGSVTQALTVAAGLAPLSVTLNGTPALIKLSLETPVLALGTAGTSILDVDAYDASGALIVAPGSFTSPLTIASDSTAVSLSSTAASAPGTKITVTYGGSSSAPYAVHFTGSGAGIASNQVVGATLTIAPNQSMAVLGHSTSTNGFATLALTSTSAVPQAFNIFANPDTTDLIPGGGFAALPGGGYVTTMTPGLTCSLIIYPAGSASGTVAATYNDNGTCAVAAEADSDILASNKTPNSQLTEYSVSGTAVTPTGRTIALTGAQVPGGLVNALFVAVNTSGAIALVGNSAGTNYLLTYASGTSGTTAPTATLSLGASFPISGLAIGSTGTVDVLTHPNLSNYQVIEYAAGLGSSVTLTENAPSGGSIISHGVAIDSAGESLVLQSTLTSTYVPNAGVDVWAPGATSAPERTVPVQDALGQWGVLYGPQIVASPAPPASNTAVAGDMFGYVANRTWTYLVTPGYGTPYYIGIYADPNLVNGNVRLVGYQSTSASSLFTSGNKIGSIDLTQLNGSYLAAAFTSVSSGTNGISGSVPGTPLLVPGSLALGQTWNPLQNAGIANVVGITASAQVTVTGNVPGLSACPSGSGTSGATVQYTATVNGAGVQMSPSFISYVPGCGITSVQWGGVESAVVLQSVGSMPSLGQEDVPPGQPPIVAALHRLWQSTFNVHPPKP
jgi:hypothetical protein